MNIEALQAENKELRFALDREIDERNKIGVMYEELLKEKAELEKRIEFHLGQIEASRSLGMSHFKTMLYVVWPQALRNALPTIANELIVNIKDSSVLNIITVSELFMAGQIAATTYMTVASYTIVALIYLILTLLCSFLLKLIEKKMDKDTVIAGRKLKMKVVTYDD